ncbi:MAG: PDZ domain-containing protein [Planctomycetota bacterium]|nr:MAG: PDZ domain-containing protein [Planctomycetota bacterium]
MKFTHLLAALTLTASPLAAQSGLLGVELTAGDNQGVAIVNVNEGTSAALMGLKAGDVLLQVNGTKVSMDNLGEALGSRKPGEYLNLLVARGDRAMRIDGFMGRRQPNTAKEGGGFMGVSIQDGENNGVEVVEVHDHTPAEVMGLKGGDVLLAVDGEKTRNIAALGQVLSTRAPGQIVELTVRREGQVKNMKGVLGVRPAEVEPLPALIKEKHEAPSLNVEQITESLEGIGVDSAAGDTSVQFVFPEDIPESERKKLVAKLREQFGERVSVEFSDDLGHIVVEDVPEPEPEELFEIEVAEAEVIEEPVLEEAVFEDVTHGYSHEAVWHDSLEAAMASAKKSGKPVLVDFYADWCGPCKRLGREVLHNAKFNEVVGQFEAVQIDVDEHTKLAEKFGVRGIPDVRILSADGKELESFVGYGGVETTVASLKKAASTHGAKRAVGPAAPVAKAQAEAAVRQAEMEARRAALRARIAEVEAEIAALKEELKRIREEGGR